MFYFPGFASDIVTLSNNYFKKTSSDTFTSTHSFFNSFLLGVAFIYPATVPLTKKRRFNYAPFRAIASIFRCRGRDEGVGEGERGEEQEVGELGEIGKDKI